LTQEYEKINLFMMDGIEFKFTYHPRGDSHVLPAYDAAQALYGIARSLSITTHYALNGRVIHQAPSLKNAKVLVTPPRAGSFEFIVPIVDLVTSREVVGGTVSTVMGGLILALTKLIYRRATGQPEQNTSDEVARLQREKHGDIDALTEIINQDIQRIHRPFLGANVTHLNIYGGENHIGVFDQKTCDYAKTKVLGDKPEEFVGNVASFNANTFNGGLWLKEEGRVIAFSKDRSSIVKDEERALLAWSLSEYAHGRSGVLRIRGISLRSKQGQLKRIFVISVEKA
jgi:hypothetical protein